MRIFARLPGFRNLIIVAAGLILTAMFALVMVILGMRDDAIREAGNETGNIATILAEQTSRSVQSIELVLADVQERLAALRAREGEDALKSKAVHDLLQERLARLPQADVIAIIDANGASLNTSRVFPPPAIDVRDRDYFRHFQTHTDASLYVGEPVPARLAGQPTIFFSKRLKGSNDEFAGVVIVGLKLTHFRHVYETITSIRDQSFLFSRKDGTVLVRHPDIQDRAGARIPAGSPWHRMVAEGGGAYRSPGYFDSTPRLVSVRPVGDYPLVVNVAYSEDAALANWRRRALLLVLGASLTVLCAVLLLRALAGQVRRLLVSEASLAEGQARLSEKSRQLETAKMQLDAAVNNISHGLCMFDPEQRLIVCNRRYAEMYGLPPEDTAPGTTLRTILERRVASGNAPANADEYIQTRIREVTGGVPYSRENELRDGRVISVLHQPMPDGGWVAIHQDVTQQKRAEKKIAYMAHHDALTGLPNRTLLREHVQRSLTYLPRGESVAILCLDLDHFKNVNDSLGHPAGDGLLRAVAQRLGECVRESDLVARLGGDEFAVVQVGASQPRAATALAQRLIEALGAPFDLDGNQAVIGTSVGVAIGPEDGIDPDALLKNGDMALYRAKADGRNTVRFFEAGMDARMQARRRLELDLRKALQEGEFELFYQPQVNLSAGQVSGFEALLRWNHPARGRISPDQFIPVAEETGLIIPLGEWVVRQACAEAVRWPASLTVAVNLSPVQFRSKGLVGTVVSALASAGLNASRLELEITEAVLLQSSEETVRLLHRLRDLGVRISMDDFGTGHSSLSYLRSFQFDKIKIDRSFIRDLSVRGDSRAIVRAVSGLGVDLAMATTAEGVETQEQLDLVRAEGCTEVQGYFFSPPCPASEVPAVLAALSKMRVAA